MSRKLILVVICVFLAIFVALSVFCPYLYPLPMCPSQNSNSEEKAYSCGDGLCNENCFDCPKDCPCRQGEYCSLNKTCRVAYCGNKECEFGEYSKNCCIDCPCVEGGFCNDLTLSCEPINSEIIEESGDAWVRNYLKNKGLEDFIIADSRYNLCAGKPCKEYVLVSNKTYAEAVVLVREDGSVRIIEDIK